MLSLLSLALWLAGVQAGQVPRPSATTARGSIQGVVVRAGAAVGAQRELPDARVELNPGKIALSTGAGGTFTFRNLAPGRYTLAVTRDGFVPQEDPRHGITAAGLRITVGAGQDLKDVVLPMIPSPVLSGRVIGSNGSPSGGSCSGVLAPSYPLRSAAQDRQKRYDE